MLTPTALARSGSGPCEQLRIWNLRHETFRKWRLAIIVEIPSLLLQIALVLFLTGLVGYLWQLDSQVAIPTLALVALLLLFQFIVSVAPLFVSYSPFTSLQSRTLLWIVTPLVIKPAYWIGERVCFWLWYNIDHFQDVEDLLYQTYSFCSRRLEDIVAAQSYVHNSWAQEESAFLRSEEGLAIDNSIMANSLSLIHDHGILRPILEICLQNMLPEQSFANLVTMYKRMPPILSDDVNTPLWATDPETLGIYKKMHAGVVKYIKQEFEDHDVGDGINRGKAAPDYKDFALIALDYSLGIHREATVEGQSGALEVYLQLFDLLSPRVQLSNDIASEILKLIWRYDDYFLIRDKAGESGITPIS